MYPPFSSHTRQQTSRSEFHDNRHCISRQATFKNHFSTPFILKRVKGDRVRRKNVTVRSWKTTLAGKVKAERKEGLFDLHSFEVPELVIFYCQYYITFSLHQHLMRKISFEKITNQIIKRNLHYNRNTAIATNLALCLLTKTLQRSL